MIQTCATCFFFIKSPMELSKGSCRFMPPTPFLIGGGNLASAQPPVTPEMWCGQYMDDPSKTEKITHEL